MAARRLSTGIEHYVAVVVSSTRVGLSHGTISVYVDGVLGTPLSTSLPSKTNPTSLVHTNTSLSFVSTANAFLGASNYPLDPHLNGSIDEFSLYNTALDAATIAAHFQAGPVPVPEPSTLLLALGFVALVGMQSLRRWQPL